MKSLDQQAKEIVAVMVKARVLSREEQHRAECLLMESLRERIAPLLSVCPSCSQLYNTSEDAELSVQK